MSVRKSWIGCVLAGLLVLIAAGPVVAEPIMVRSPDGRNTIELAAERDAVLCTMRRDGVPFLDGAALDLPVAGAAMGDVSLIESERSSVDRVVRPVVPTIAAELVDRYNEAVVRVDEARSIRLRAYDDGVAYRWELRSANTTVVVSDEVLDLSGVSGQRTWLPMPNGQGFWSHQECTFEEGVFGELLDDRPRSTPVLFNLERGEHAVLSDIGNDAYPGLWIVNEGEGPRAVFPPYPKTEVIQNMRNTRVGEAESWIARVDGDAVLPWRAVAFDDALGLLDDGLFYLLSEPSRIEDTDWIEPGLVSWDWWNALNITGVDFETGVDQRTYMHFIDFAAEYGLPYVILDEG